MQWSLVAISCTKWSNFLKNLIVNNMLYMAKIVAQIYFEPIFKMFGNYRQKMPNTMESNILRYDYDQKIPPSIG